MKLKLCMQSQFTSHVPSSPTLVIGVKAVEQSFLSLEYIKMAYKSISVWS